jgi:predicted dehydrogenase
MLEQTAPEAVYVLMPPHHLFDIVIHCLTQKRHVFIEKPPGVTTYQTRAMALTAEKNGCLTMTGFNRRHIPAMTKAYDMVRERGAMHQCVSTFYKNHLGGGMYYNGSIDILYCDAIHAVDTLRWMGGGEVVKVSSSVRRLYKEFETSWLALVEFDSGCVGVLLTNWVTGKRVHTFEMHGKGISAFVNPDPDGQTFIYADGKNEPVHSYTTIEIAGSNASNKSYGFFQESRHFVDCLHSGQPPLTNFADGVKTMELADMIMKFAI